MITSKKTLEKIKQIVENNYSQLVISVLGNSVFSKEELKEMKKQGIDTSENNSLLNLVYFHNFINKPNSENRPLTTEEMQDQQSNTHLLPKGEAHDYALEHSNESAKNLIDKVKQNVMTRIEGIVRDNNNNYKVNALQNLKRSEEGDLLVKESMLSPLKKKLKDIDKEANSEFSRIITTEVSNSIGVGSTDRIVADNRETPLSTIFVYRIAIKNDNKTCKYCKEFYLDSDGTPKVYRLQTLLSNGSNYGKKAIDWRPTTQATHPNERCSQVIELKPGWKVLPDGQQTYIGLSKWEDYIVNKVKA